VNDSEGIRRKAIVKLPIPPAIILCGLLLIASLAACQCPLLAQSPLNLSISIIILFSELLLKSAYHQRSCHPLPAYKEVKNWSIVIPDITMLWYTDLNGNSPLLDQ